MIQVEEVIDELTILFDVDDLVSQRIRYPLQDGFVLPNRVLITEHIEVRRILKNDHIFKEPSNRRHRSNVSRSELDVSEETLHSIGQELERIQPMIDWFIRFRKNAYREQHALILEHDAFVCAVDADDLAIFSIQLRLQLRSADRSSEDGRT